MSIETQQLKTLRDIKQIMERSSRFISLSGLSGVSAGICALVGAWFANNILKESGWEDVSNLELQIPVRGEGLHVQDYINNPLFLIAIAVLVSALIFGFLFTYLRSKKTNTPIWGTQARKLLLNMMIPMIAGGIFLLKVIDTGAYGLVAPGCLLFYGLALLNASRFTLGEVRYLGYFEILLGLLNLYFIGKGLLFWTLGFGVLHIVYGAYMWWKYERVDGISN